MKVTFFIGCLFGGGAERVVCNLSNYLVDKGHKVEVLTVADVKETYGLSQQVTRIPLLRDGERRNLIYNTLLRMRRLRRYVREKKDVDAYVVMLPATIVMLMLLRFFTKAKIIHSERNDPQNYSRWLQMLLRHYARKADGIVFQTEMVKGWYERCLRRTKGIVISNAINPAFMGSGYEGPRDKTVVAVGRLNFQKNFPLLLRSFAKVAAAFPEYKLLIYGKGLLQDTLIAMTRELGISDRVEFLGYVSDMPERLKRAGMFVLSSDYEGMPNALMEAMASGLPCVSTDCGGGGARFLIRDGENGLLVPIGDEVALADAMEKVLSDEELAAKLGNNARKLQETLAPDKIYGEWEAFIKEIVKEK